VAGTVYLISRFPSAHAQEETTISVPIAQKPLGLEHLENEKWLNADLWRDDSLEVPFAQNTLKRQAYLRMKWT
jgi:hypothetical protein